MAGELEQYLKQQATEAAAQGRLKMEEALVHGTGTPRPERLFSTYDDSRAGWCVWAAREGAVLARFVAGPFGSREEAESLLGNAAPGALPEA